jgi:multisubunit Na+/H+ antiporter MnhG subunit
VTYAKLIALTVVETIGIAFFFFGMLVANWYLIGSLD